MMKRIMALLLALTLVLGYAPIPALAEDTASDVCPLCGEVTCSGEEAHPDWCYTCEADVCENDPGHPVCEICEKTGCVEDHSENTPAVLSDSGEDTTGETPTDNKEITTPDTGSTVAEGETPEACETCGKTDCESDHTNWCDICKADDCGKEHKACDKCGTVDCTLEHANWCETCGKDDCGVDHNAAETCETCGEEGCESDHTNWCEQCMKDDCGVDHSASSEDTTTDGETSTEDTTDEDTSTEDTTGTQEPQACEICGKTDCESAHDNWCEICKADDCGKTHVYCETCQKNDCGIDHSTGCTQCDDPDCDGEHTYCDFCQKNDCGQTHCPDCGGIDGHTILCDQYTQAFCDKCGALEENGTLTHKDGCPTLCSCTPVDGVHQEGCKLYVEPEEPTFAEKMLVIDNLSDLLIEICKDENYYDLIELTADEIQSIQVYAQELFDALKEPSEQDERDFADILDILSILPNFPVANDTTELPDLIPGDYESIMAHMEALAAEAQEVSSYEDFNDLYDRLCVVRNSARDYQDMLELWQLNEVECKFYEIRDILETKFGFSYRTSLDIQGRRTFELPHRSVDESSIVYNKVAEEVEGKENEFLLTLDAYVTGEATTITKTKPADIVLVLDQSASMYAPMGAPSGRDNLTIYDPVAEGHTNVKQYSEKEFLELSESDPDFLSNASQLGYYVAQSHSGGFEYCENKAKTGHTCSNQNDCRTYDWFVIQYDNGIWKMYRIPKTSNPSHDSKVTRVQKNGEKVELVTSHGPALVNISGGADSVQDILDTSGFVFYKSQYGALYDAISSFAEGIVEADAGHRLAVVGFSAEIEYQIYATGSGLYINGDYKRFNSRQYYDTDSSTGFTTTGFTTWDSIYNATTLSAADYKNALMTASPSNYANIMNSVKAVESDSYGTNHDVGINMANRIFAENPIGADEKRDRIVIMFTDGSPSPNSLKAYTSGYSSAAAGMRDAFIDQSAKAKNDYNAQIYTIWTSTLADSSSNFMRYGSSDYPDATSYSNHGTQISSPKYASGVKSGEDLLNAFGSVFEDVSNATTTELKTETVIRDIVAPSFTLPTPNIEGWEYMEEEEQLEELAKLIAVYESKYHGNNEFAEAGDDDYTVFEAADVVVSKDADGLYQVDVKNFDFSANYVTDLELGGHRGSKLVIQIPIELRPDFLGGDNVVTNGPTSGIYDKDGNPVGTFDVPNVSIEVSNFKPIVNMKDIYISQTAELPSVINLGQYEQNGGTFTVDGINNAYADLVYIIEELDTNGYPTENKVTYTIPRGTFDMVGQGWVESGDLTTHPLLKEDTSYRVTIQVIASDSNKSSEYTDDTVHVYKPTVTFQDSAINLGETPKYDATTTAATGGKLSEKMNYVSVEWKHGETVADSEAMGDAPDLVYNYTPEASDFKTDTNVMVTVTAAKSSANKVPVAQDITEYVTFYRDACNYDDCPHTTQMQVPVEDNRINFVVHLKSFDLKITKTGWNANDEYQTYVFRVTNADGFSMDVTITGNGDTTIKGLPAGEYNVRELTEWSWRYTPDGEATGKPVSSADAVNGVTTVDFTNTRTNPFWLSGDSFAKNQWDSEGNIGKNISQKAS